MNKHKKIIMTGMLSLTLGGLLMSTMFQPVDARYGENRSSNQTQGTAQVSTVSAVSAEELVQLERILTVLIKDEYKARAEYQAIVSKFGEVTPFVNLIKAETSHIRALTQLFSTYGLEVPTDNGSDFSVVPSTLVDAYAMGIKAETDNIALYQAFLENELPTNVENVFTHLMNASESHLSIFEDYRDGKTNVDCDPVQNSQNMQSRQNRKNK
jgi:hypothetical protein